MYTHGISKFLNIVMWEFLKDLMKNLFLGFIQLFDIGPKEDIAHFLRVSALPLLRDRLVLGIKFWPFVRNFDG